MGKIILVVILGAYLIFPVYSHAEDSKQAEEELRDEYLIKQWRSDIIPLGQIDRHRCSSPVLDSDECSKEIASKNWKEFKNTYEDGDAIWFYCSPAGTWENLMGSQGYAIFRNDKLIKSYTTLMN